MKLIVKLSGKNVKKAIYYQTIFFIKNSDRDFFSFNGNVGGERDGNLVGKNDEVADLLQDQSLHDLPIKI